MGDRDSSSHQAKEKPERNQSEYSEPEQSGSSGVDTAKPQNPRFEIKTRSLSLQDSQVGGFLNQARATGTMTGTPERVHFSGPWQQTDIDLDAIQAVEHKRDKVNSILIVFGGLVFLLGILGLGANPSRGLLLLLIGLGLGAIAYIIRGETLVLITGGKKFKFRSLSVQESRKIVKYIRELKQERNEKVDSFQQSSVNNSQQESTTD